MVLISWAKPLIDLIREYGYWGIVVIFVVFIFYLVRIILDEDKSGAWRARFYKVLYKITCKSKAEKKFIENDVSSRINMARRSMPFGKEYLPKAIKIEWFEGGQGSAAQIKENEIIIKLDPAESQEKNIVLLTTALVKQTSLVGIRHILKEPLEVSMDLNLVKNLLLQTGLKKILDWFFRNEYQPNLDKSSEIREWNSKIVEIDERGLFIRLLLVELDAYSKRVLGRRPSTETFDEIVGLVNFLYKISTKGQAQDVPLDYISRDIKIGIILVGVTSKILHEGITPYLRTFAHEMGKQLSSIYVIQFDKEFLGEVNLTAYKEFAELTQRLNTRIEESFEIQTDFKIAYTFRNSSGKKSKAKIFHYIPKYVND